MRSATLSCPIHFIICDKPRQYEIRKGLRNRNGEEGKTVNDVASRSGIMHLNAVPTAVLSFRLREGLFRLAALGYRKRDGVLMPLLAYKESQGKTGWITHRGKGRV
jgi:hypothetical protein